MDVNSDNLLEILVLQTGGTIDKDYPRVKGAYAFHIGEPAVCGMMQRIQPDVRFVYRTVCRKDSQDVSGEDRELLWNACRDAAQAHILITHGTDTMIHTAAYLATKEPRLADKTVVLTGAFLPATFRDSEAEFNVGVAVGALQCLARPGVFVAMSGRLRPWNKVTRDDKSGRFITARP